jgi:two-component system KDP operon response regulator KdpE
LPTNQQGGGSRLISSQLQDNLADKRLPGFPFWPIHRFPMGPGALILNTRPLYCEPGNLPDVDPDAWRTASSQLKEKTILIIDDDRRLSEWLRGALADSGATVSIAANGVDGLHKFLVLRPDLVLMNGRLPARAGMALLREIRLLADIPVLMLAPSAGNREIVGYLDAGADDFVAKPIERQVLLARIRALLRRARWRRLRQGDYAYDDGRLVIDLASVRVTADGRRVKLSATEFALLTHLVRRAGRTCTFTEILSDVWGEPFTTNQEYVHAYMWQLRRKLEPDPSKPAYLQSVRGQGYRFVAHEPAVP